MKRTFEPHAFVEVDASGALPALEAERAPCLVLVRLHERPLGLLELERPLSAAELAEEVERALGDRIREHLQADAETGETVPACLRERERFLETAPEATVVVATRDRPESLATTLASIAALAYPSFDVLVVDSAPSTDEARDVVRVAADGGLEVRYLRETRPGLAVAHNVGLAEARGAVVAFADDDVIVDRNWLTELSRALSAQPDVACATGLILPLELETPAQIWLERYARLNKGFERRRYDLGEHAAPGPLYPYTAGLFGSGASMAFDTSVLRKLGGFDPATGAGTAARGGDDLLAFVRVLRAGHAIVYEPAALLRHAYRRDLASLERQMFGYGAGLTAYLTGTIAERPSTVFELLRRLPRGVAYALGEGKSPRLSAPFERKLIRSERLGMLYGPFGYLAGRLRPRTG